MFRSVVFDFDGTLVDSNAIKDRVFLHVVREHREGPRLMRHVLNTVKGDRHAIFAAYASAQGLTTTGATLLAAFTEQVDAEVAAAAEMPGAQALLRSLRSAGMRLVLSSATPRDSLTSILEARGWASLFDDVAGSPAKKSETLRSLVDALALQPTEVAVVGDGADDRESAAAVGCPFFPVGEARGALGPETVYTLPQLQFALTVKHPPSFA